MAFLFVYTSVYVCVRKCLLVAGTSGSLPPWVRSAEPTGQGEGLSVEFTTHRTDVSNS